MTSSLPLRFIVLLHICMLSNCTSIATSEHVAGVHGASRLGSQTLATQTTGIHQELSTRAMLSLAQYDSELEAVTAAIQRFNPYSIDEDREYLGAIIVNKGKYQFLVARGRPHQDRVTIHLPIPKGADLVAFWHTHGAAGPHRHLFSGVDTQLVRSTGKPFYMANHRGELRVFRDGDPMLSMSAQRRLGLHGRGYAEGVLL